jgi:hypothetical protein
VPVRSRLVSHGLGVQVVPDPCQVLGLAQAACVVTVQLPVKAQQAPVGVVAVGLSSPPQPAETMTRIAATINSLRIHSPFSFVRLGCGLWNDRTTRAEAAQDARSRVGAVGKPGAGEIGRLGHFCVTLNG